MEVLLRADIEKLGARGEIVGVADGYARNYLIPKGLAAKVNKANIQQLEAEKRRREREQEREAAKLQHLADRISAVSLTITAPATEAGHLYGSVGPEEVAGALVAEGFTVAPEAVELETHIKELGVYEVTVRVSEEATAKVRVWVVGG